jgi:hypothetical protein
LRLPDESEEESWLELSGDAEERVERGWRGLFVKERPGVSVVRNCVGVCFEDEGWRGARLFSTGEVTRSFVEKMELGSIDMLPAAGESVLNM